MAINIGAPAIDRATSGGPQFTWALLDTPCPFDGTLTTVELWAHANLSNAKVASFSRNGNKLTSRDYALLGDVPGGSKQTFNDLEIEIVAGDLIGIHADLSGLEIDSSGGDGLYYCEGDQIGTGEQTYTLIANYIASLGGWVTIAAGAPARRSYGFVIG